MLKMALKDNGFTEGYYSLAVIYSEFSVVIYMLELLSIIARRLNMSIWPEKPLTGDYVCSIRPIKSDDNHITAARNGPLSLRRKKNQLAKSLI